MHSIPKLVSSYSSDVSALFHCPLTTHPPSRIFHPHLCFSPTPWLRIFTVSSCLPTTAQPHNILYIVCPLWPSCWFPIRSCPRNPDNWSPFTSLAYANKSDWTSLISLCQIYQVGQTSHYLYLAIILVESIPLRQTSRNPPATSFFKSPYSCSCPYSF